MSTSKCQLCQSTIVEEGEYCAPCLVKAIHVRRLVHHGLSKDVAVFVQYNVRGEENKKIQQTIWE